MKKCGSCSKDLPEAALHCVFCGAKQPPAPAVQPGLAKTAFGYSANDVANHLKQQPAQPQPAPQAPRPHSPSQPNFPQGAQNPAQAATMFAPPSGPGSAPGGFGQPQGGGFGGPPPQQGGFGGPPPQQGGFGGPPPQQGGFGGPPQGGFGAPPQQGGFGGPPQGGFGGPPQGGFGAPPPQQGGFGGPPQGGFGAPPQGGFGGPPQGGFGAPPPQGAPPQGYGAPQPIQAVPPYLASQTAARSGHPIEPWKDALKAMMFIWGIVALVAFVTPVSTEPMVFNWDAILHAPGKAKIPSLLIVSIGLLSIVIAAMPMLAMPKGAIAAVLGLSGVFVPLLITDLPPWQLLLPLVGSIALVPGLLVRDEYREAMLPRVLVTIGVICVLLPLLIPVHSQIPLVSLFKGLIDAPGKLKVIAALELAHIVVVVLALLAWMPAPATGAAKIIAWILILFPALAQLVGLLLSEGIGTQIKASPFMSLMLWAPGATYAVLIGYGLATVIGKQLE